ncbi:GIY-YIG nuclease family protein [Lactiplantibacillus pentosus]|uniref:GIY-YIG nuclease family protein n=1 Tax=Lactiplantibacillus pentosus TaxID=1589 RepID=UPI0021A4A520|nr:GIY-YIG nuclease family protein [Lactiplantibacillus pentosus]MCT3287031.1 GIY-YIG nuclease family protein [Lactiplantibacillus pentosus]
MAKQTADTRPADQVTVKQYYFYVLLCADATLYGGFTDNLERRLATHNAGKGAKYTRVKSRRPVKMIYHETFNDKSSALKAEYAFKHQSRAAKLKYLSAHDVKI